MSNGGLLLAILPTILVAGALRLWALWLAWGWFLVPLGMPEATWPHVAGVGTALAAMTYADRTTNTKEGLSAREVQTLLVRALVSPVVLLGFIWLWHALM